MEKEIEALFILLQPENPENTTEWTIFSHPLYGPCLVFEADRETKSKLASSGGIRDIKIDLDFASHSVRTKLSFLKLFFFQKVSFRLAR